MRFIYADPPYIGQAKKHYGDDPHAGEVDHKDLLRILALYDGWALSCSSSSLQEILGYCTEWDLHPRIGSWVKPFAIFKPNVNPGYTWEPVLFSPLPRKRSRTEPTIRDFVSANITLRKGVHGAKPDDFWIWLFQLVGLRSDDIFVDMYPGTGRGLALWKEKIACAERPVINANSLS